MLPQNGKSVVSMWRSYHSYRAFIRNVCVRVPRVPESSSWMPRCCRPSQGEKVVVDNVTGRVEGGTFLAVVGASGSGKTTLLAAITKRLTGSNVTGDILLNGRSESVKLMSAVCGFVPQRDLATETLTAAEHLSFMAAMQMDARTPAASRARRVRALLADLGLTDCAHTRLGTLSGGERRRLAVAVQLLVSPAVLVLDEPCSGLDSEAARSVLEILRREANRGRAVLCTVHQAAPDALALFNAILVLVNGRVAYHGPRQDAHDFLTRAGARCPEGWPESLALNGVLHRLSDPSLSARKEALAVCDAFSATHTHTEITSQEVRPHPLQSYCTVKRPSLLMQFCWLAWRGLVDTRRNIKTHIFNLALFLITSVIMALSFVNVSPTSMTGVQGARGLLYLVTSEVVFTHSYGVFHTFPAELPVYLREARLYSPAAYYLAKVLLLTPRAFLQSILFLSVVQSVVDVTAGGGFPTYCALVGSLFAAALVSCAYGCMVSALCESSTTALHVTMPIDFLSLLTTGIFNSLPSLPAAVSWLRYLSIFFYGYSSLSILFWNNVEHINCAPNVPCLSDGKEVLEDSGFNPDGISNNLLGLSSLLVGFHLVGFLGVVKRSRQQSVY